MESSMTSPYLALESVSYALPDGRTLFSQLSETFDQRPTGLVGRNGVGKTMLARLLAGQLEPTGGRCLRSGSVHYLAQQVSPPADATVASLAGVHHTLEALLRIESGSSAPKTSTRLASAGTFASACGMNWNAMA